MQKSLFAIIIIVLLLSSFCSILAGFQRTENKFKTDIENVIATRNKVSENALK